MASVNHEQGIKLLKEATFSDMTLTCRQHVFKAHKAILCSVSNFFACSMEGGFVEAREGNINIGDTKPLILGLALVYIYTGGYSIATVRDIWADIGKPTKYPSDRLNMTFTQLQVYSLADRLLLPSLRTYAGQQFHLEFDKGNWNEWWPHERKGRFTDLVTLAEQVYYTLPGNDMDIRVKVTHYAAKKVDGTASTKNVLSLLQDFEPIALGVYQMQMQMETESESETE